MWGVANRTAHNNQLQELLGKAIVILDTRGKVSLNILQQSLHITPKVAQQVMYFMENRGLLPTSPIIPRAR